LLDVTASVAEGRLQIAWTYSERLHRAETIESLAQRHLEALRALIAHCLSPEAGGYTPSDFPEADLTQVELDRVLAGVELDDEGAE
jgi:microcystin synthetase protein McyA